ncbi:DUF2627 domain-containing protein [Salisediminibacterium halotolerans]|uniref:DUF2627 domain-containing protein n=1 Tax=Salisediminibacterium halotolerans TaxID=517425 RepID=A0A1H9PFT4_9BACI|nr:MULTISPECIES: DUF2627 domain-containing protein [Salisediminibacterium]RLJ78065.1 uncharacterized protein DUF2627 [Actinophytocola xinjiangensis]RPE88597.1 uncharacterized protein DUF2627 [Salisediminibacterium halotolerans]TWG37042.1 uncharacterized protein DUF2627 [Salisediminibacterium halotolerans]SER46715.1 Protein of unknown function [Salisediminibacterium haloalkalitolerans]GEL06896.1 hypothetical protein SHA02_03120 [Salisediminibacterium halotolerans]
MTSQRFIALIVLLIPIFTAGYGIKQMRDTLFQIINWPYPSGYIQFLAGLAAFLIGVWFIGGFLLYRDRKNKKVSVQFEKTASKSR